MPSALLRRQAWREASPPVGWASPTTTGEVFVVPLHRITPSCQSTVHSSQFPSIQSWCSVGFSRKLLHNLLVLFCYSYPSLVPRDVYSLWRSCQSIILPSSGMISFHSQALVLFCCYVHSFALSDSRSSNHPMLSRSCCFITHCIHMRLRLSCFADSIGELRFGAFFIRTKVKSRKKSERNENSICC